MDVILHVGAHRTATALFQHHLAAHRAVLRASRTAYWGPNVVRGGLFRGVMDGAVPVMRRQRDRAAKRLALRVEMLRQEGADRLVISDPNILGALGHILEDARLYPDAGARIAAHCKGLARHNVTIAISMRRYDDWWASAMAAHMRRGGPLPVTRLRDYMITQPRRWRHIIEDVARAVPDANVVVWTHEACARDPGAVLRGLTGITTSATPSGPRNGRPSATHLRDVMADCGETLPLMTGADGLFMPFEPYEVDTLRAQYEDDLAWLAQGAGGFADCIETQDAAQTASDRNLHTTTMCDGHGEGSTNGGDYEQLA
ncbi:hypothetical protein V8J82_12295 [Gymnodinialimonas sp. 2305UL16-5]|uniref:hypothetical protein n=1 Tax=Gymnodinialimonas mytili TaxID=3126503 RepID=UPI0030ADE5B9